MAGKGRAALVTEGMATRWKPGQSGNPKGRPRKNPIMDAGLRNLTEEDLDYIWSVAISQAKAGDPVARAWIADRLEGKAIARREEVEPGDFDQEKISLDQARKVLGLGAYLKKRDGKTG